MNLSAPALTSIFDKTHTPFDKIPNDDAVALKTGQAATQNDSVITGQGLRVIMDSVAPAVKLVPHAQRIIHHQIGAVAGKKRSGMAATVTAPP